MGKLLEQLRDNYKTKEAEIQAPILKIANEERRQKEVAVSKYHEIEFKLGQDIIQYAMDQAKYQISLILSEQLFKVLKNRNGGVVNLQFDLSLLSLASPDKQLQILLNEYARMSRPTLKINSDMLTSVELIEISIPQLNIRLPVTK